MGVRRRPSEAERYAAGERIIPPLRVKARVTEALARLIAETGESKAGLISRLILEEEAREFDDKNTD
jgi:hypothetical protein